MSNFDKFKDVLKKCDAILVAVASTDLVYNGALLNTIREYQKPRIAEYNEIKGRGEA